MTVDQAALWREHAHLYGNDILAFGRDQWTVKDTGKLIHFERHQEHMLACLFTRGGITEESHPDVWARLTDEGKAHMQRTPAGQFPWKTMIWSEPKKSGKSEVGGLVGMWVPLSEPGVNEVYFIANDQEQSAGRGYARIADHLNPFSPSYNRAFASLMRTKVRGNTRTPTRLDFLAGDLIRAIPTDFAGESGANPTISVWDELWAYTRENLMRLWEEFTIVPTRPNSCRFVTTYAGFRDESELLWTLYQRTVRHGVRMHKDYELWGSQAGDTVSFWSHTPRMPWQTPEYYRQEKASLRKPAYRRLHENRWTRSASAFIDPEWWDNLPRYVKPTPRQVEKMPVYIGGDASHKRDSTAGMAVGWAGYPVLLDHRIWTPGEGTPVIPEDTLGPWIERMCALYNVRRIGCDPNHMETLLYRLGDKGLPVEEFTQSVDKLTSAADALYTFVKSGKLLLYPNTGDLDAHVLAATAKETPRGWRIDKGMARKHIDGAVALAMSLSLARQYGPKELGAAIAFFFLGAPDATDEDGGWK